PPHWGCYRRSRSRTENCRRRRRGHVHHRRGTTLDVRAGRGIGHQCPLWRPLCDRDIWCEGARSPPLPPLQGPLGVSGPPYWPLSLSAPGGGHFSLAWRGSRHLISLRRVADNHQQTAEQQADGNGRDTHIDGVHGRLKSELDFVTAWSEVYTPHQIIAAQ